MIKPNNNHRFSRENETKKTKGKKMNKNAKKQYKVLMKHVYDARAAKKAAEMAITAIHEKLDLNDKTTPMSACRNKFERVVFAHTNDDTGFTQDCDLFRSNDFCANVKCTRFAKHANFVVANEKLVAAEKALNDFIKNTKSR